MRQPVKRCFAHTPFTGVARSAVGSSVRVRASQYTPDVSALSLPITSSSDAGSKASDAASFAAANIGQAATDSLSSAGLDVGSLPTEYLIVAGVAVVALIGIGAAASGSFGGGAAADEAGTQKVGKEALPRKNAVIVFGASGRTGSSLVKLLLQAGRTVIACCRSGKAGKAKFRELGLKEGRQNEGEGILFVENGVDITKPSTLSKNLFQGATQAVIAVGAARASGSNLPAKNASSEAIDGTGVGNVAEAAAKFLPRADPITLEPMMQASDFANWKPVDDQVMGGSSSSSVSVEDGSSVAKWSGELIVEGGGFCSVQSPQESNDLSMYDGLALRVRGEGQTLKFNIKTKDVEDKPITAYQATFDTVAGDWTTVYLPWHEFVPTTQAKFDPELPPLDPSKISSIGILYSRFNFNGVSNPNHKPGPFTVEIDGGVSVMTAARPKLVLMSSAHTERNALIGDNAEARKADVPIVQLNPVGTLNWKYKGEVAVRACGLPYAVVRPTGLVGSDAEFDEPDTQPYVLEFAQGDEIAGIVGRQDVAMVLATALSTPAASGATFEVRRTERRALGGPATLSSDLVQREFLTLLPDCCRPKLGLRPLPEFVEPPAPVTEERKKEILEDPRVKAAAARSTELKKKTDAAAKTPQKESSKPSGSNDMAQDASMSLRKAAVQRWIADYRSRATSDSASVGKSEAETSAPSAEDIAANKSAVQNWISAWRAKTPEKAGVGKTESNSDGAADDIEANKAAAQKWIAEWRSKQKVKVTA